MGNDDGRAQRNVGNPFGGDGDLKPDLFFGVSLNDVHVGDPGDVESDQRDIAPDAAGDQIGSPVPAEVTRLLAQPVPPLLLHRAAPLGQAALPHLLLDVRGGRGEVYFDLVSAHLEPLFDVELPGAKHVGGAGDLATVDADSGQRVEPLAAQENAVASQQRTGDGKGARVGPAGATDPLGGELLIAVERICDLFRLEQSVVDVAGNGGRNSFGCIGLAELPAAVEGLCLHEISFLYSLIFQLLSAVETAS